MRYACLLLLFLVICGCFREDEIRPVIVLNGGSSINYPFGEEFVDPGVVAEDNRDGDISRYVTVSGHINTNLTGTYQLTYNVTDAAGNPARELTRLIYVRHHPESIAGIYISEGGCSTSQEYFTLISPEEGENFALTHLLELSDSLLIKGEITGLTGQGINIKPQELNDTIYQGSGSIDGQGEKIELLIHRSSVNFNDTCTITLTR